MMSKQVRAQYTQEFKLEAVRQVQQGQSAAAVGKILGIPKASLANWVRQAAQGALHDAGVSEFLCKRVELQLTQRRSPN